MQSKFLRQIFALLGCVPNASLRLESGLPSVTTQAWLRTFNFWLRLNLASSGLIRYVMEDSHKSVWNKNIKAKLCTLGLSPDLLLPIGNYRARNIVKQRLYDIEHQNDLSATTKLCPWYGHYVTRHPNIKAQYLFTLTSPSYRRAFTLARLIAMPSTLLQGCFG